MGLWLLAYYAAATIAAVTFMLVLSHLLGESHHERIRISGRWCTTR